MNKTLATVLKDHGDAYVQDCPMNGTRLLRRRAPSHSC